ncbi:hypothetical protein JYT87_01575 [Nitrospira defluvii]|nr:hypothetical protein [Nitrospira defluvii]
MNRRRLIDPFQHFTQKERECIEDVHFFKTKAIITQKIKQFLHEFYDALKTEIVIETLLRPQGFDSQNRQFVKGEHLLDFPYQYLDYPKFFLHGEKFTFRTLFWWGHYFVLAWTLEGEFLQHYKQNLLGHYKQLADKGLFISLADTPWEWRKGSEHLIEIRVENEKEIALVLKKRPFLKVQFFIDFDHPALLEGGLKEEALKGFRLILPIVYKNPHHDSVRTSKMP